MNILQELALENKSQLLNKIEKVIKIIESLTDKEVFDICSEFEKNEIISTIEQIKVYYEESQFYKIYPNAKAEILSVRASALRVLQMAKQDVDKMYKKLEFELLPLLENLRLNFYYYNWIGEDENKRKEFFQNEAYYYYNNRYLEKAKNIGRYKYELSIVVVAYNKLEYTKKCIYSLKKYLPKDISYELILFNNGSTDGTKEFFESQNPDKQLDIEVNGGMGYGYLRLLEGRYKLSISNDVLITENAIQNIYECIKSDRRIGWVVPTTPNISNFQDIGGVYKTIEEMYDFASKNNILDENRWEERARLCNPVDIMRLEDWFDILSKEFILQVGESFPDDRISCVFRRKGLKLVLAKDAYCYHYGSITHHIDDSRRAYAKYCKGRIKFIKQFGMDPWGYGAAYDINLINGISIKHATLGKILGINSGIGGNPLKIKAMLREYTAIKDAKITYITQFDMNQKDIEGLGSKVYKLKEWIEYPRVLNEKYDFMLLENGIHIRNVQYVKGLLKFITEKGQILVRVEDDRIKNILSEFCNVEFIAGNSWLKIIK